MENLLTSSRRITPLPSGKENKEDAETTRKGLKKRSVQNIRNNWKESGKPSSSREKCDRSKNPPAIVIVITYKSVEKQR